MPLEKTDESSLIIAITEAIQNGTASKNGLALPKEWGKSTYKLLSEAAQKHFNKVLDDGGLEAFVLRELNYSYRLSADDLPSTKVKIAEMAPFVDALATAKKITAELSSLPRQYRMIVRGPAELGDRLKRNDVNIKISDRLTLISGALISDNFKVSHENESINKFIKVSNAEEKVPNSFDDSSLYFEYRTSGCISIGTDTKIARDFFDAIRSFYGAAMALEIIDNFDHKQQNLTPWVVANELNNDESELCYVARSDDDIIKATNIATTIDYDTIIENDTEDLEKSISPIVKMFSSKDGHKLLTAAIWIFRANLSPRSMDTILESTIAIEVLLGDRETSDRIGLSKLMANRCAYALGKSINERKEIIDFFVDFYKVRSDIVHNGKFKIENGEKNVVYKGLTLSQRILRHEINLLN
nr:HEPN domain-containing protein [Sphingomonas sp. CDS-1]